jgi:hypothetical protein
MKFVPSIGADYSGSLGGITASRNRYGQYFRRKASPVNPNSTRQAVVRNAFSTAIVSWTALTAAQRAAWNTYASNTPFVDGLGNQKFVTGQNMYVRSAVLRQQIGIAIIATAPTVFNFGNPPTNFYATNNGDPAVPSIGETGGAISETSDITGGASADGDLIAFIGKPINASRAFYKGPYQFMASSATTSGATTQTWDDEQFQTAGVVIGEYRPVRVLIAYDDGRVSSSLEKIALVIDDL